MLAAPVLFLHVVHEKWSSASEAQWYCQVPEEAQQTVFFHDIWWQCFASLDKSPTPHQFVFWSTAEDLSELLVWPGPSQAA